MRQTQNVQADTFVEIQYVSRNSGSRKFGLHVEDPETQSRRATRHGSGRAFSRRTQEQEEVILVFVGGQKARLNAQCEGEARVGLRDEIKMTRLYGVRKAVLKTTRIEWLFW